MTEGGTPATTSVWRWGDVRNRGYGDHLEVERLTDDCVSVTAQEEEGARGGGRIVQILLGLGDAREMGRALLAAASEEPKP